MTTTIQLNFKVPRSYKHIWMLHGKESPLAFIGVNGRSVIKMGISEDAEEVMSDVLDWQQEVMEQIRLDNEKTH